MPEWVRSVPPCRACYRARCSACISFRVSVPGMPWADVGYASVPVFFQACTGRSFLGVDLVSRPISTLKAVNASSDFYAPNASSRSHACLSARIEDRWVRMTSAGSPSPPFGWEDGGCWESWPRPDSSTSRAHGRFLNFSRCTVSSKFPVP